MSDRIAVVNAGSSSIKFGVFEMGVDERLLFKGQVEQIGVAPQIVRAEIQPVKAWLKRNGVRRTWTTQSATRVILETIIGLNERQIGRGSRPQGCPRRHGFR